jgi:hypothetical protein
MPFKNKATSTLFGVVEVICDRFRRMFRGRGRATSVWLVKDLRPFVKSNSLGSNRTQIGSHEQE